MTNEVHNIHKKSKLEEFQLGFEFNRTFKEERQITKQRTHNQ